MADLCTDANAAIWLDKLPTLTGAMIGGLLKNGDLFSFPEHWRNIWKDYWIVGFLRKRKEEHSQLIDVGFGQISLLNHHRANIGLKPIKITSRRAE